MSKFFRQALLGLALALCVPFAVAAQTVPPPSKGLGSNRNYVLSNDDCKPLTDLKVTVDVTQDLVGSNGLGFQLNAYSLSLNPPPPVIWQQYMLGISVEKSKPWIHPSIENWSKSNGILIRGGKDLLALPSIKIPAGYKLQIVLENDKNGNVTGATFAVIDNQGKTHSMTEELKSLAKYSPADLAPIVAFELNLVGPKGDILSSGAGAITYTASSPMTVSNKEPSCVATHTITAETTNSVYGALPASPSKTFTQTFGVAPPPAQQ